MPRALGIQSRTDCRGAVFVDTLLADGLTDLPVGLNPPPSLARPRDLACGVQ